MHWIQQISNFKDLPNNGIWVSLQEGKADYYRNHSAFIKRDKVLVFATNKHAQHFINNWDCSSMNNYKQACLNENHTFWVIDKTPSGYYADDITIYLTQ